MNEKENDVLCKIDCISFNSTFLRNSCGTDVNYAHGKSFAKRCPFLAFSIIVFLNTIKTQFIFENGMAAVFRMAPRIKLVF